MGELLRSRIAQLVVDDGLLSARRGSGYLVSPNAVLTAAHVVRGAVSVLVRFNVDLDDEWVSSASVEFADSASELGVVILTNPAASAVGGVQFGRLGERAAVVPYEAVGFPRFKFRKEAPAGDAAGFTRYRDAAHLHGTIASLANWREGTLELVADPPDRDPDPDHSPWEGMSGAAVWCAGRIVGVVSEHHRSDGLNRLAATPFHTVYRQLGRERWQDLAELVGLPRDPTGLVDVEPPSLADSIGEGYLAQVENIAPSGLIGRDEELNVLTRFCAGEEPYQWWRADAWYGKTALASWVVLHPPAGVRVVSFFITGPLTSQSDHSAYDRELIQQLAVITGDTGLLDANLTDWDGQRFRLTKKAAAQMFAAGQRLLLVVDGLDEDRGAPPVGRTSIASLLPRRPPPGLRVLVTSRPNPGIPSDVPGDHPLRGCRVKELSPSGQAKNIKDMANAELEEHFNSGDPVRIDILGLITAAGGGLTISELAELLQLPRFAVENHVTGGFGRSLKLRAASTLDPPDTEPMLTFGHEALHEQAQVRLADQIPVYRARIDAWVGGYRTSGWPDESPWFAFRPYARLVTTTGGARLLAELATDRRRHDRMLQKTSGDASALEEITDAYELLINAPAPRDVADLILLAFEYHRVASRGAAIPPALPAVWVSLGNYPRALALSRSIIDDYEQSQALTALASALAAAGHNADAEDIARSITDDEQRAAALSALVTALAATGHFIDAERIACSITDDYWQARALAALAAALAGAGQSADSYRSAIDAEHCARSITEDYWQARALSAVATAFAAAGRSADAHRLAIDAEHIAPSIADESRRRWALAGVAAALAAAGQFAEAERVANTFTKDQQAWVLATVAAALAAAGQSVEAERIARSITDVEHQAQALTAVAAALAAAGQSADAHRLAIDAERIARSITDEEHQAQALTAVAAALAAAGQSADAHRLAIDAERIARSITDAGRQAVTLAAVVTAFAATGESAEAHRLAIDAGNCARSVNDEEYRRSWALDALATAGQSAEAERAARSITDDEQQAQTLTAVATALAAAGQTTDARRLAIDAEHCARSITDDEQEALALTAVVNALAAAGQTTHAEPVARSITDEEQRALALTAVATALAAAGHSAEAHRLAIDAERVARSITDDEQEALALTAVAAALAAAGQTADAERVARSITDDDQQTRALTAIAAALAAAGQTADAERVARSITDDDQRGWTLTSVATALAAAGQIDDAYRLAIDAERIARSITDDYQRGWTLTSVATALAAAGQTADAERVARSFTHRRERSRALSAVAATLAAAGQTDDAYRLAIDAERIARSLTKDDQRAWLLIAAAKAMATAGQIDDAHRLAIDAEHLARSFTDDYPKLAMATRLAAAGQTPEAEQLARSITDDYQQGQALSSVAAALAAAGQTVAAQRICVERLLEPNWAGIVHTLVSLSTGVDTGFAQRLNTGLVS
jgi:hypothetical protein